MKRGKSMKRKIIGIICLIIFMLASACGNNEEQNNIFIEKGEEIMSYNAIDQKTAYELMNSDDFKGIVLDVRTKEEYAQGHIPKAICVPNETITDVEPSELPDKNQTILVYCRSGRRSKEAASKLANMGYADIREFGGIIDWKYEIE